MITRHHNKTHPISIKEKRHKIQKKSFRFRILFSNSFIRIISFRTFNNISAHNNYFWSLNTIMSIRLTIKP